MSKLNGSSLRSGARVLVIGRDVTIVGALTLKDDVVVEGLVDGEVRCTALLIAEHGMVEGLIVAERVVILGEFSGTIYARELSLRTGCVVEGQIHHNKLVLDQGCFFEGVSRRHAEPLRLAPELQARPRAEAWIRTLQDSVA